MKRLEDKLTKKGDIIIPSKEFRQTTNAFGS